MKFIIINCMALMLLTGISKGTLTVISPVFKNNSDIPVQYTCEGENINPPLTISSLPNGTQTLAIIVEDPDAPMGTFVHWVAWNIPPVKQIKERSAPGVQGKNGAGKTGYTGPCPPSGTHHYKFHVYALDTSLNLTEHDGRNELEKAMKDHILAEGLLVGLYKKVKSTGMK